MPGTVGSAARGGVLDSGFEQDISLSSGLQWANSLPRDGPERLGVVLGIDPLAFSGWGSDPEHGERAPKREAPSGLSAGEGFAHVESVSGALVS